MVKTESLSRFVHFYILPTVPFIILLSLYWIFSYQRHHEFTNDKLLPNITELINGFKQTAIEPDRNGDIRLQIDTVASFERLGISLFLIVLGALIGLFMGSIKLIESLLYKFILFFDKIPALAVLPILFLTTGLGEATKITLIVIGVAPTVILDTYLRAKAVPQEQIIKALTLDASKIDVIFRIVLPKIFPNILDILRLNFKGMILFLIAGESLAATVGLGYRIFLVRRYLAMDIIIPYVLWISLIAFFGDWLIRLWISKRYQWLYRE